MMTIDVLTNQLTALNTARAEGADTSAALDLLRANVKTYNAERRDGYARSLCVADDPRAIMAAYIRGQYYTALRVGVDTATADWTLTETRARLTFRAFAALADETGMTISTRANWYRYLVALCDNIVLQTYGDGDGYTRINTKGDAFTTSQDLREFKDAHGFTVGSDGVSNRALMQQLALVYAAILPDNMTNCDGEPLTPVKADLNHIKCELLKAVTSEKFIGTKVAAAAAMEKALCGTLVKRLDKLAYPIQQREDKTKTVKREKSAPDTTTMPKAGDVKEVAPAKKTRKTAAKESESAA